MKATAIRDVYTPIEVNLEVTHVDEEDLLITLAEGLTTDKLRPVADTFGDEAAELLIQLVEEVGFAILEMENDQVYA